MNHTHPVGRFPLSMMRLHGHLCRLSHDHGCRRGQVATYLVVWVAVLVLLTMVVMNVGQVAMARTITANAADQTALQLASNLGAVSRQQCAILEREGGGPQCEVVCSDNGEFVLKLITESIIVAIVGLILCGWVCAVVLLILWAVNTVLQETMVRQHQMDVFNERMENLSVHDQIRETAIVTAFIATVDDRRQEADVDVGVPPNTDIDRDGDQTEMVSAFAKWFNRRLVQLDRDMAPARNLIKKMILGDPNFPGDMSLMEFRRISWRFRQMLQDTFIPIMQWIEGASWVEETSPGVFATRHYDITWWAPDLQLPQMNTGVAQGTCAVGGTGVPCTPWDVIGIPDTVDWMMSLGDRITARGEREVIDGTPKAFEEWIRTLVRCKPADNCDPAAPVQYYEPTNYRMRKRTMRKLGQWLPILEGYWVNQINFWKTVTTIWINDLTNIRADMCLKYGGPSCMPPSPPAPALPPPPVASGHPIDWAIERIREFQNQIDLLNVEISVLIPRSVSEDDPIYDWRDERGWHMVRVEVGDFEVPRLKAAQHLVLPTEAPVCGLVGACLQSCVGVEAKEANVSIAVTRFDEDRGINRMWNFRMRDKPDQDYRTQFSLDFTGPGRGRHLNDLLQQYGIRSVSSARYTWRPNSVRLRRVR